MFLTTYKSVKTPKITYKHIHYSSFPFPVFFRFFFFLFFCYFSPSFFYFSQFLSYFPNFFYFFHFSSIFSISLIFIYFISSFSFKDFLKFSFFVISFPFLSNLLTNTQVVNNFHTASGPEEHTKA